MNNCVKQSTRMFKLVKKSRFSFLKASYSWGFRCCLIMTVSCIIDKTSRCVCPARAYVLLPNALPWDRVRGHFYCRFLSLSPFSQNSDIPPRYRKTVIKRELLYENKWHPFGASDFRSHLNEVASIKCLTLFRNCWVRTSQMPYRPCSEVFLVLSRSPYWAELTYDWLPFRND